MFGLSTKKSEYKKLHVLSEEVDSARRDYIDFETTGKEKFLNKAINKLKFVKGEEKIIDRCFIELKQTLPIEQITPLSYFNTFDIQINYLLAHLEAARKSNNVGKNKKVQPRDP